MFKHAQISWIFLFLRGGGIFDFVFLSHFLTKQWCFGAHLKGNYLQSWKNTLLLTLFHFFKPQRALKWKSYFLRRNFTEAWKGLLDSWRCQMRCPFYYFTSPIFWTFSWSSSRTNIPHELVGTKYINRTVFASWIQWCKNIS